MAKIKGETIEVIRSKCYKLVGIKCDVCGQIIRPPVKYSDLLNNENKYFSVTTGHHDWGIVTVNSSPAVDKGTSHPREGIAGSFVCNLRLRR